MADSFSTDLSVRSCFLVACSFIGYMTLGTALSLYNKWMFSILGLAIPLSVSAIHQILGSVWIFVFVAPSFCGVKRWCYSVSGMTSTRLPMWQRVAFILFLSIFIASNLGLNNVSLVYLSLVDVQLVRATFPFFTLITFLIVEGRRPHWSQLLAVFVVVAGAVLTVAAHATRWKMSVVGLVICGISVLCAAMMTSVVATFAGGKPMFAYVCARRRQRRGKDKAAPPTLKLNGLETALYTGLPSGLFITPFIFLTGEHKQWARFGGRHTYAELIGWIAIGTVMALLYNLAHYEFIQRTTSLFTSVTGTFRMVIVIFLSELLVQYTSLPPLSVLGVAVVVVGFLLMAFFEEALRRARAKQRAEDRRDGVSDPLVVAEADSESGVTAEAEAEAEADGDGDGEEYGAGGGRKTE